MSAERKDEPDIDRPASCRLRLVKTPETKQSKTSAELKASLDDMRRRYSVSRERVERDRGDNDAA